MLTELQHRVYEVTAPKQLIYITHLYNTMFYQHRICPCTRATTIVMMDIVDLWQPGTDDM